MKAKVSIIRQRVITRPVEMYTPERVREFDAAEQKLTAWFGANAPAVKRAARSKRRSFR